MSKQRWRRGESRDRLIAATLTAIADVGPGAVSGRSIARDADVYHAQIQQMFGSVDELVRCAVLSERDRFIAGAFGDETSLPDPLAVVDHPAFWRAVAQALLDPGPIDLRALAEGGPVDLLARRLNDRRPGRAAGFESAIAAAWAAAPLGALIFEEPLRRGLGINDRDWDACWERLGDRVRSLTELDGLPAAPPASPLPPMQEPSTADRGRERLLHAAERLLETRLETTIAGRELAAAAGVNYGLVSHYFGSKTTVFDEALTNLHERFLVDILAVVRPAIEFGAFEAFHRHRAFLRAWASRLLRRQPTPEFKLLGMARLRAHVLATRSIGSDDGPETLAATGDCLTSIALQLGWTILHPLPAALDPQAFSEVVSQLRAINAWILDPNESPPR